ncbi:Denticleless protein-like [Holothuria leucospilota]|uniref:Denticleless protein-like n=1 Tax=Holothuria leucospilota TaxID=206669 RepID=A0A9Q1HIE0_HOLLE|nr:Denticleless protein-like [Holothuria leucospilota]
MLSVSSQKFKREAFYSLTEGLKNLSCYPPDQFVFLQSEDVDELVPSFAAAFSNTEQHLLAVADEDGVVRFFDTRKTLANGFVSGFEGHDNAIFDLIWAHNEPWIVTASGDQTAVLWDAPTGKKKSVFKQHTGSLKSVSFGIESNSILATGARDGSIMIWDTRAGKKRPYLIIRISVKNAKHTIYCSFKSGKARTHTTPVITISKAHEDKDLSRVKPRWRRGMSKAMLNINPLQSVTAVLFQSDSMLLSSGSADGVVKMWDMRALPKKSKKITPDPYQRYNYGGNSQGKHGFSSLTIDSSHSRFYANCTDGTIYAYDCVGLPSSDPAAIYSGHINSTFYVKSTLSTDDTYLLSGSSDSNAYIWKVDEPDSPPIILSGHSGEVTAVAWSPLDKMRIATCADDCTMRIWRRKTQDEKDEEKPIGNAKWQPPSQEPHRHYSEPHRPLSPIPDVQPSSSQSPTVSDQDLPKTVSKGKFNLRAWAMTPAKEKKPKQGEGESPLRKFSREGSMKGQDGDTLRTRDRQRDSEDKTSAHTSMISSTNEQTKGSPDLKNNTYCKKRARRIASLKDWIDGKDSENAKNKNSKTVNRVDDNPSCEESKSGMIAKGTSSKGNKENHFQSKRVHATSVSPPGEVELTALQEQNNSAGPSERVPPHSDDEDTIHRPGSEHHPKRESLKRGRGDQIFDYFQPLKRMRKDSQPDKR